MANTKQKKHALTLRTDKEIIEWLYERAKSSGRVTLSNEINFLLRETMKRDINRAGWK